jgi:hypothetical protein
MKIKLRKNYKFIGGHLFKNVSHLKEYEVVDKWCVSKYIIDDSGQRICVSNSAFKKYFKEV